MATKLETMRRGIHRDQRRGTSSHDPYGTKDLVATSVTDASLRDRLGACLPRSPCWLACCPLCSRRKGSRYYRQSLRKAVDGLPMTELRWVTVNVLETADLEDGSFKLKHTEHEALKHIVSKLRSEAWLYRGVAVLSIPR